MDFIIDLLVEVILGTLSEGFVTLSASFMPNKALPEKAKKTLYVIFAFIGMLLFVALIVGVILLLESQGKSILGWILVIISGIYLLTSIILKIISVIKEEISATRTQQEVNK